MICLSHLVFGFIVVIVMIIFYYLGRYKQQINHLHGFYDTDIEFNKESGLSMFSLYIGDMLSCSFTNVYNGYLLMISDNNNVIINEQIEFCLSPDIKYNINDIITNNRNLKFICRFKNLETKLIPDIMFVDFYPLTNKLVFYKDNKIYSVFFKNPVLSELEHISKEKPQDNIIVDKNCETI